MAPEVLSYAQAQQAAAVTQSNEANHMHPVSYEGDAAGMAACCYS